MCVTDFLFCRTRTPGCRYGHTVCQFKGRLYMYGGRNDEDGSFSQVDCYDTSEPSPPLSLSFALSFLPLSIETHIHTSPSPPLSLSHLLSLLTHAHTYTYTHTRTKARRVWLKLHTSGDGPSSRDGHACTVLGSEMLVHGGFASRVSIT